MAGPLSSAESSFNYKHLFEAFFNDLTRSFKEIGKARGETGREKMRRTLPINAFNMASNFRVHLDLPGSSAYRLMNIFMRILNDGDLYRCK